MVSTVAGRFPRRLSLVRKLVVAGKLHEQEAKLDARFWPKAYGLALSIFAVEVALLYLFTLRFS